MSKWTIVWQREGDPAMMACAGLSPEVAIFRLRAAIKNSGPITVRAVHHEVEAGREADDEKEGDIG